MSKRKSPPLGNFFIICALSAAAGFALRVHAAALLAPLVRGQVAAYALVFVAAFALLSFLSHRVTLKFSLKAKGLETTQGAAPQIARAVLAAFAFFAPLALLQARAPAGGVSLESLIAASDKKAAARPEQGYQQDDREHLGKLMGEQQ